MTITEALAVACADLYSDNVSVMIDQEHPESIFVLRTTRPISVVLEKGEMYLSTARYGFPEELENEPIMLPLFYACDVTRKGIRVTRDKMDMEPVAEMTPYTYKEAYKRFEAMLKSKDAPLYFDDLERAVAREMRDLWPGDHTYIQHGRLVYDMLWQFDREGRLKREMRIQENAEGQRRRWYFSLKD